MRLKSQEPTSQTTRLDLEAPSRCSMISWEQETKRKRQALKNSCLIRNIKRVKVKCSHNIDIFGIKLSDDFSSVPVLLKQYMTVYSFRKGSNSGGLFVRGLPTFGRCEFSHRRSQIRPVAHLYFALTTLYFASTHTFTGIRLQVWGRRAASQVDAGARLVPREGDRARSARLAGDGTTLVGGRS